MDWLQDKAEELGCQIYLAVLPGAFVHPATVLAYVLGDLPEDISKITHAFTIGDTRSFEQDPRFGLSVLSEIAERALSPAVNDPGTAIDILGRALRLFAPLAAHRDPALMFPRIWVPPLTLSDMMDDIFPPIARDGATIFAVQIRLQKTLLALAQIAPSRFSSLAQHHSAMAISRCRRNMLPNEIDALQAVSDQIAETQMPPRARPL
jgi:uncharacterized membrane protein